MKRGNYVWANEEKTEVKFEECNNGKFLLSN
jgi:hypothetical protein